MTTLAPTPTVMSDLALALGAGLLAASAYFAARPGAKASSFGWAIISGLAFAILALAAAIRAPNSGGFAAALLQLATISLAGALAALSLAPRDQESASRRPGLGAVGRGLAWIALVGLPPTLGFHAKVTLYRALLVADWGWVMLLAMAASAALLIAGLRELRTLEAGELRGPRAVSVMALIALMVILGFYPYLWLIVNTITGHLAASG